MSYLISPLFTEEFSRILSFQVVAALRDLLTIAIRRHYPPSYEQSINILHDLDPELYKDVTDLIRNKNENDIVRYFREEANLQTSVKRRQFCAEKLIKKELKRLQILRFKSDLNDHEIKLVLQRISNLMSGLENLKPRCSVQENFLDKVTLLHDPCTKYLRNIRVRGSAAYHLSSGRTLKIRTILPEHKFYCSGVDLVYIQYNLDRKKVRILTFNYFTWDDGHISEKSSSVLLRRISQTRKLNCQKGNCSSTGGSESGDYRFPLCSSFLRLTDKIKTPESRISSCSYLFPVCSALKLLSSDRNINRGNAAKFAIKLKLFVELFTLNFIGSEWLEESVLENYIRNYFGVNRPDSILLMATEMM